MRKRKMLEVYRESVRAGIIVTGGAQEAKWITIDEDKYSRIKKLEVGDKKLRELLYHTVTKAENGYSILGILDTKIDVDERGKRVHFAKVKIRITLRTLEQAMWSIKNAKKYSTKEGEPILREVPFLWN